MQPSRPKTSGPDRPHDGSVRMSEAGRERDPFFARMFSFIAYTGAVWLVTLSVQASKIEPAFGSAWSYAVLGADLAVATALLRDEIGLRARLGITDPSGLMAKLVWGLVGVVAILGITFLPR